MGVVSDDLIVFLVLFSAVGSANGHFGIKEPYPKNQYPLEHTSADITCVAYDHTGAKIPEKILFVREKSGTVTDLTANDNIYFTNRTEDNGRKLFVTFHIRNATMQDDSREGSLGRYQCHAFATGDSAPQKFGFSVTVIKRKEIPKVVATTVDTLQYGDEARFYCNITDRGSLETSLDKMSWLKDGKEVQSKQNPSITELNPVVIKNVSLNDGGNYTCVLEMRLRGVKHYSVRDTTLVSIAPWFEDEEENNINVAMIRRNITLKCGARGFPNVEWKVKKKNDGMIYACIDSSRDKRLKISRNGTYEPHFLSITNLTTNDIGDYYCCLSSNCSANIDGRCQRFRLTVIDPSSSGAMVVVSRTVLLAMVFPLALFLSM